jgi:hypothetical protein
MGPLAPRNYFAHNGLGKGLQIGATPPPPAGS